MDDNLFAGVNNIIKSVNNGVVLSCDAECRENRNISKLYDDYMKAKENVSTAPVRLDQAEEKYFVYTKGEEWYDQFRLERLSAEGDKVADYLLNEFKQKGKRLRALRADAKASKRYETQLSDLHGKYAREIAELEKKTDRLTTKANVNHRLTSYDVENIERKTRNLSRMKTVYYMLAVIFGLVQFLHFKRFREWKSWLAIISLLIVPRFLTYIIRLLRFVKIQNVSNPFDKS